jgi:hypothetical protein
VFRNVLNEKGIVVERVGYIPISFIRWSGAERRRSSTELLRVYNAPRYP